MKHVRVTELNEFQAKQFNFERLGVGEFRKDFTFLVFDGEELIAEYILMNNDDHQCFEGISEHVELNADDIGYLYWIETSKRNTLRSILSNMANKHNIRTIILECSERLLPLWKHLGAIEYKDLYDDFREIHTLSLDMEKIDNSLKKELCINQ